MLGGPQHATYNPADATRTAERKPLKVLLIEDSEADACLIQTALEDAGYELQWSRVETAPELTTALEQATWDLVLADFSLPRFDALRALAIVRASEHADVPFIIVSGAIGEETAVAAMRAGAHDYVLKDKLDRLAPAVERELRAALDRAQGAALEKRLMHTERLAAIGQLAAGVAHEINNPLTFILGNMEILAEHVEQLRILLALCENASKELGPAARALRGFLQAEEIGDLLDDVDDIRVASMSGVERIASIVRDLKTFSRIEQDDVDMVDINEVAGTACHMVENTIRHRATLVREFHKVPMFLGDAGKLTQVVVNLLVNAAQAIGGGQRADDNQIAVTTICADETIVLTVADTGRGIPPDVLEQIFEPFFTTKSRDEGTGLGLSLCADIIRKHRGEITVTSKPGVGTSFTIRIPLATGLRPTRRQRSASSDPNTVAGTDPIIAGRGMRILLIDDEQEIVRTYERALARGPDLVSVCCGEDALALLERDAEFDVVLCDVMLPGIDGPAVYRELLARWPALALRTLFITGGALSENAREFLQQMGDRVLRKPIAPQRLMHILLRVVDQIVPGPAGPASSA